MRQYINGVLQANKLKEMIAANKAKVGANKGAGAGAEKTSSPPMPNFSSSYVASKPSGPPVSNSCK
jgi:hypothetical protein